MNDHATRLALLGTFRILNPPRSAKGALSVKQKAVLAYLSAYPQKAIRRETLSQLIWPDSESKYSRHSLSQALYAINQRLPGWLAADVDTIRLSHSTIEDIDIHRVHHLVRHSRLVEAADLVTGTFLEDLGSVSETFDDWKNGFNASFDKTLTSATFSLPTFQQQTPLRDTLQRLLLESTDFLTALPELAAITACSPSVSDTEQKTIEVPFLGRATEKAGLLELWRAAQSGKGNVAVVVGNPGSGKSRLLDEVLKITNCSRHALVRCYETEKRIGLNPIADLLNKVISDTTIAGLSVTHRRVLAELLPRFDITGESPPKLSRHASERRLFESIITAIVAEAGHSPLLLIIDDIQWADPATSALLHLFARRINSSAVLMICASRSRSMRNPDGHILQLNALTQDDLHALHHIIQSAFGNVHSDSLMRITGGNPFLLTEYVKRLERRKTNGLAGLRRELGHQSINDFVNTSLTDLTQAARRLLGALAVLGRPVSPRLLRRTARMTSVRFAAALDELIDNEVVTVQPLIGFRHDLFRQAVYSRISPFTRRHLHFQSACAWRTATGSAGRIAFHLYKARKPRVAYQYAVRAASEADSRYALREARLFLTLAAKTAERSETKCLLHKELAFRQFRARNYKQATKHLHKALHQHGSRLSEGDKLKLVVLELDLLMTMGRLRYDELINHIHDVNTRFAHVMDRETMFEILRMRLRAAALAGHAAKVSEAATRLVDLAASNNDTISARALSIAARGESYVHSAFAALPWAIEAEKLAHELEDPEIKSEILSNVSSVYYEAGMLAEALRISDSILRILGDVGALNPWPDAATQKQMFLVEMGDYASARAMAADLLSNYDESEVRQGLATLHGNLAIMEFYLDNFEQSEKHARTALRHTERFSVYTHIVSGHALVGLNLLEKGLLQEAQQHADTIDKNMQAIGHRLGDFSFVEMFRARLRVRLGRRGEAVSGLQHAIEDCKERDATSHLRMKLELARILRQSDPTTAKCLCNEVKTAAVQYGIRPLVVHADSILSKIR